MLWLLGVLCLLFFVILFVWLVWCFAATCDLLVVKVISVFTD